MRSALYLPGFIKCVKTKRNNRPLSNLKYEIIFFLFKNERLLSGSKCTPAVY